MTSEIRRNAVVVLSSNNFLCSSTVHILNTTLTCVSRKIGCQWPHFYLLMKNFVEVFVLTFLIKNSSVERSNPEAGGVGEG